jgi:hypothetical protein
VTTTPAEPRVLVRVPDGWHETGLSPPDVSQTPGVHVLAWHAWGPGDPASASLVAGCFEGALGTWTPEAEPIVLERLRAVVAGAAVRVARFGQYRVTSTVRADGVTREILEGQGDAEHQLAAQTFLGFVAPAGGPQELLGCFALCTVDLPACNPSVADATVAAEFVQPPAASLPLRLIVLAVHHPSTSLGAGLTLCFVFALVLVATRRRPRTK